MLEGPESGMHSDPCGKTLFFETPFLACVGAGLVLSRSDRVDGAVVLTLGACGLVLSDAG